jgi:hypothetical protein
MDDTLAAGTPAGGEPGPFARLIGVLFSPGKTFESIARRPAWVVPVVLVILCTTVVGFLVTRRFDADAIFDKAIAKAEQKQGRTFPAEQLETQRKVSSFFIKIGFLFGTLFVTIALFLVPLIYHGLMKMLGNAGRYPPVLSAYANVQITQVIKGLLFLVVALQHATIEPQEIPFLLKSNVAALCMDPETTSGGLRAIGSAIDVFDLWGLVLMTIGLQKVRGVSRGTALGIVVGVWLLYVLVSAGFASVGAAFGGG